MVVQAASKLCTGCLVRLPTDSFHRHAGRPSGLHDRCKACRAVGGQVQRQAVWRRAERSTVLQITRRLRMGHPVAGLDANDELLIGVLALRHFGGVQGLARALWETFEACSPASRERLSILLALTRLMERTGEAKEAAHLRRRTEIDEMSEEELGDWMEGFLRDRCGPGGGGR